MMPKVGERGCKNGNLMRFLDDEYLKLHDAHYKAAPTGGRIPVGGGNWMDTFFRMEAIRGMAGALRLGKSVDGSLAEGKAVATISIQLWNKRREWQVHRWEKAVDEFLDNLLRRFKQRSDYAQAKT